MGHGPWRASSSSRQSAGGSGPAEGLQDRGDARIGEVERRLPGIGGGTSLAAEEGEHRITFRTRPAGAVDASSKRRRDPRSLADRGAAACETSDAALLGRCRKSRQSRPRRAAMRRAHDVGVRGRPRRPARDAAPGRWTCAVPVGRATGRAAPRRGSDERRAMTGCTRLMRRRTDRRGSTHAVVAPVRA